MALHFLEEAAGNFTEEWMEKVLTTTSQKLLDSFLSSLKNLHLPDHEGQTRVFCTNLKYATNDVRISGFTHPESTVTIDGNIIHWTVKNIGVAGDGNWQYSYMYLFDSAGDMKLAVNGITVSASVAISNDLDLKLMEYTCTFGDVDFNVHGGALCCSSIMCLLRLLVRPELRTTVLKLLKKGLEEMVEDTVPSLNSLQKYLPEGLKLPF